MNPQYLPYPPNREVKEVYAWDRNKLEYLAPHYHDHVEIMYIVSGQIEIELDYKKYMFFEGDAVLLFPNQIHWFIDPCGNSRTYTYIFKTEICPNYKQIFDTKRPDCPIIKGANKIPNVIENLKLILNECESQEKYSTQIIAGSLQLLLGLLLRCCSLLDRGNIDEGTAERILGYCHKHFTEDITLTSTAAALGLSTYYLSHLIPKKYGMHFGELIAALRMEKAIHLIQEGNKISSSAIQAGFSEVRAFNRAFLKQYGMPPTEYLKLKNKDLE